MDLSSLRFLSLKQLLRSAVPVAVTGALYVVLNDNLPLIMN